MGVTDGHRDPRAPQHRQVHDVVAHVGHLAGGEPRRLQDFFKNGQLVRNALIHPLHAQFAGPVLHHARFAPREEHHLDAGPPDHLQTVTVPNVEALRFLSVVADDDTAVGEHPVHIENERFHIPHPVGQVRLPLRLEIHLRPFFMSSFTIPSIPWSMRRRSRRESSASEFGPSQRALSGSGWTSRNRASTPTAAAARAR